jgi:hypothetical protein
LEIRRQFRTPKCPSKQNCYEIYGLGKILGLVNASAPPSPRQPFIPIESPMGYIVAVQRSNVLFGYSHFWRGEKID